MPRKKKCYICKKSPKSLAKYDNKDGGYIYICKHHTLSEGFQVGLSIELIKLNHDALSPHDLKILENARQTAKRISKWPAWKRGLNNE